MAESSPKKIFRVSDIRHPQILRQKSKARWLVCYQDSPEGNGKPDAKGSQNITINRIIGTAVIIMNDKGDILVGKRKGSHGDGTWGLPGGHIDHIVHRKYPAGEDQKLEGKDLEEKKLEDKKIEDEELQDQNLDNLTKRDVKKIETEAATSVREVYEETGLVIKEESVNNFTTTWDTFNEKETGFEHYNTFFVTCKMVDPNAEPRIREPDKCEEWRFLSWDELREIWDGYPVIEDKEYEEGTEDHRRAEAAKKSDGNKKKDKLFLPLAKLVSSSLTFEGLRP